MHLVKSSPTWFPYFGNQKRFVPYVLELLSGLGAQPGDTYYETNAGSHAISSAVSNELGLEVIANDLGFYSQQIGIALSSNNPSDWRLAAEGAAIMEEYGYNPPDDAKPNKELVDKWIAFIAQHDTVGEMFDYRVTRGNLFEEIKYANGDYIYCDFAWPWRDGTATEEYETTSDTFGKLLGDDSKCEFKVASARRILNDVIQYLDIARRNFRWVILSNQSSNYPTPEVIEAHMKACGHVPYISRRLTVPAEHVDNLGKDDFFTEYQYVFRGYNQ